MPQRHAGLLLFRPLPLSAAVDPLRSRLTSRYQARQGRCHPDRRAGSVPHPLPGIRRCDDLHFIRGDKVAGVVQALATIQELLDASQRMKKRASGRSM